MTKKTKVFFLNAPPGAGKDTAAVFLQNYVEGTENDVGGLNVAAHTFFKQRLYTVLGAIYGVSTEQVKEINDNRETKEVPQECFDNKSVRNTLIEVSEKVIKPVYGADYFGLAVLRDLKSMSSRGVTHIFLSDCGFTAEVDTIVKTELFDCYLIQFSRVGTTFEGDSRNYIEWFGETENFHRISNDGSIAEFEQTLIDIIKPLLN